jgi:hypothetical protein
MKSDFVAENRRRPAAERRADCHQQKARRKHQSRSRQQSFFSGQIRRRRIFRAFKKRAERRKQRRRDISDPQISALVTSRNISATPTRIKSDQSSPAAAKNGQRKFRQSAKRKRTAKVGRRTKFPPLSAKRFGNDAHQAQTGDEIKPVAHFGHKLSPKQIAEIAIAF